MYILSLFIKLPILPKFKANLALRWLKRLNPKPQLLKLVKRLNSTVPSCNVGGVAVYFPLATTVVKLY